MEVGDPLIGIQDDIAKQRSKPPDQLADIGMVKEIDVVFESPRDRLTDLAHRQLHVELRRADLGRSVVEWLVLVALRVRRPTSWLSARWRVLPRQEDLGERCVAGIALGLDLLDQLLERQILVVIGRQGQRAYAPEQ